MRFDLIDLRLFLRVAEARSITHGAQQANIALASASERIRGMEQALGVSLLVRDRRGVSLSPAGQCLLEHARLIVTQVERMKGELGCYARGLAGSIRLLSNTSALSEHLPGPLASFLAANPTISIDVEDRESTDIAAAVASGLADVGVASEAALSDAVETFPFRQDRLLLVLPHGDVQARLRECRFTDVVERDFVGLSRDSALQRHLAGHATRLGITMKVRARVSGFDAVCRMIETGVGIGVVPEASAKRCARTMRIELVRLREPWSRRRLAICVRRLKDLPIGAQKLVEHLRRPIAARSR